MHGAGDNSSVQVLARLRILHELCRLRPRSHQDDWNTCLGAEAWRDKTLKAAGIRSVYEDGPALANFFGLTEAESEVIFGCERKPSKLPVIEAVITRLEMEAAPSEAPPEAAPRAA